MIIVSQDKKTIINFDNVVGVGIDQWGDEYHVHSYVISERKCLGTYTTEKRAMDVLDKIVNAAGLGMYAYTMPKK